MKTSVKTSTLCLLVVAMSGTAMANMAILQNVPDWNQPTLADPNLPDPGPVNQWGNPGQGSTAAWCTPTASADLIGYYRDRSPSLSIADASAFPNTGARPVSDWRDDLVDTAIATPVPARTQRADLGWFLNTNNDGDGTLPFQGAMAGTHYGNILPGLANYFAAHNLVPQIINYSGMPDGFGGYLYDNSGIPAPHTVANSYLRIQSEINANRPVLLHVAYWNVVNRQLLGNNYEQAVWGDPVQSGPGGTVYITTEIGHTVVVIGWIDINDPLNPWQGQVDAIIVHDNSDGTLRADNKPLAGLVLPYGGGGAAQGLNVPWNMQTELIGVPEPATAGTVVGMSLLAGATLGRRISRARKTRS
ncbi:MAG: hypothetical protein GX456_18160 [Verrucomicrobia bacterium]|nr:hypothetical protein [Verrucomicrobiota bacterium]